MKQPRSNSYLRTFQNTPEGNVEYKKFITNIRKSGIVGGRFVKMFRGNSRPFKIWKSVVNPNGFKYYSGSSRKEGATRFDVYLNDTWKNGVRTGPSSSITILSKA